MESYCDKLVVEPIPAITVVTIRETKQSTHVETHAMKALFLYTTVRIIQTKKNWNSVETNHSQGKHPPTPILLLKGTKLLTKRMWVHAYLSQPSIISFVRTLHIGPEENRGNVAAIPMIMMTGNNILITKWTTCRM